MFVRWCLRLRCSTDRNSTTISGMYIWIHVDPVLSENVVFATRCNSHQIFWQFLWFVRPRPLAVPPHTHWPMSFDRLRRKLAPIWAWHHRLILSMLSNHIEVNYRRWRMNYSSKLCVRRHCDRYRINKSKKLLKWSMVMASSSSVNYEILPTNPFQIADDDEDDDWCTEPLRAYANTRFVKQT